MGWEIPATLEQDVRDTIKKLNADIPALLSAAEEIPYGRVYYLFLQELNRHNRYKLITKNKRAYSDAVEEILKNQFTASKQASYADIQQQVIEGTLFDWRQEIEAEEWVAAQLAKGNKVWMEFPEGDSWTLVTAPTLTQAIKWVEENTPIVEAKLYPVDSPKSIRTDPGDPLPEVPRITEGKRMSNVASKLLDKGETKLAQEVLALDEGLPEGWKPPPPSDVRKKQYQEATAKLKYQAYLKWEMKALEPWELRPQEQEAIRVELRRLIALR